MGRGNQKRRRFGLPRKLVLAASGGVLFLLTATAGGAYFMGGAGLVSGRSAAVYGVECRLVDRVAFDHGGGELWVRQFIAVGATDPLGRLRTALRVARATARRTRADLVLVVAMDEKGPTDRALMRDRAVGARVVYAPHPARVSHVNEPLSASYVDAEPTGEGEFYGKLETPSPAELQKMATAMRAPFGCRTADAAAGKKGGHRS